jgi:hypothetical protein
MHGCAGLVGKEIQPPIQCIASYSTDYIITVLNGNKQCPFYAS